MWRRTWMGDIRKVWKQYGKVDGADVPDGCLKHGYWPTDTWTDSTTIFITSSDWNNTSHSKRTSNSTRIIARWRLPRLPLSAAVLKFDVSQKWRIWSWIELWCFIVGFPLCSTFPSSCIPPYASVPSAQLALWAIPSCWEAVYILTWRTAGACANMLDGKPKMATSFWTFFQDGSNLTCLVIKPSLMIFLWNHCPCRSDFPLSCLILGG